MKAAYQDNFITAYCGDALAVLRKLPAESVHCCVTSPPYWGLRDYGTAVWEGGDAACDHKVGRFKTKVSDKQRSNNGSAGHQARDVCPRCGAKRKDDQLGLEATPEEYVARMVKYFREVKRLLRKDGTLWLNLGDSYATGAGAVGRCPGGGEQGERFLRQGHKVTQPNRMPIPGLKPKDLIGIPWRVAFALQADGWYLRSDIIWHKPNPMPESVTDRPTKAHEYIFLLTKSARYYYDAEAIKEPTLPGKPAGNKGRMNQGRLGDGGWKNDPAKSKPPKRNKRDVWIVQSEPYPGAHYATFAPKLIAPCILAGTSERGCCPKCGAPWTRLISSEANYEKREPSRVQGGRSKVDSTGWKPPTVTENGWAPGCECGEKAEPCVVLDPFGGSGTTGQVARELGRKAILIELNPEDIELRMKKRFAQELLPL